MSQAGCLIDRRTAGIPHSHHPGHFIKGLANRIILRRSQNFKRPFVFHPDQFRMSAGNHQRDQRETQFVHKAVGIDMTDDVMNRDQRFVIIPGQRFGCLDADMQ